MSVTPIIVVNKQPKQVLDVKNPVYTYYIKRSLKNKVSMQKFLNTISIIDRKIKRLEFSSKILLKASQKILEKKDKLYKNQNQNQNTSSDIMVKMQRELNANENILYQENDRIINENNKIRIKIYEKNYKRDRINQKHLFVFEMNEIQEFIHKTKSEMKSAVSIINLKRLSLLPAELILIIREYLPIEVRTQVLENTWNIPFIEIITINNNMYSDYETNQDTFMTNHYDTLTNLILIMTHCEGNDVFCNHPVFLSVFDKYNKYNKYNNSLYYYTIMFDALILLIKSFYPKLAYTVLTLIKQHKLHELKDKLIHNELIVLFPNHLDQDDQNNQYYAWY